jgi:stearoyl-CoA desaturase (delta-9 desaturase)
VFFVIQHVAPLGALYTGVTRASVVAFVVLYFVRIFFITAGYHCYFSHRAFKTSRVFQFVLAVGAQSSGQGGALGWAAGHQHHHASADQPADVHSPVQYGLYHAHFGWLCRKRYLATEARLPEQFVMFPELRWLDKHPWIPSVLLAAAMLVWLGLPGFFFSYAFSTLLTFHATFTVNSLAHRFGYRTYDTPDDSRNNWFVALIMLGGGWHNNHHRFPRVARQGFRWWEVDVTYYLLKLLERLRVVWDIREPPIAATVRRGACGRST